MSKEGERSGSAESQPPSYSGNKYCQTNALVRLL
jgi:hypothetical protein